MLGRGAIVGDIDALMVVAGGLKSDVQRERDHEDLGDFTKRGEGVRKIRHVGGLVARSDTDLLGTCAMISWRCVAPPPQPPPRISFFACAGLASHPCPCRHRLNAIFSSANPDYVYPMSLAFH